MTSESRSINTVGIEKSFNFKDLKNEPIYKSYANIKHISVYTPELGLSNKEVAVLFPGYSSDKVLKKTGIQFRPIAGKNEFSSDLATKAAKKLISQHKVDLSNVDFLIVCTQTPDFIIPSVSALVHKNLSLSKQTAFFDLNQGCSGYIYGLSVAKGLIESGTAQNILFITAETYSKILDENDKSVRTLFGDGATATLITNDGLPNSIHNFHFSSNGALAKFLVSYKGGLCQNPIAEDYLNANHLHSFESKSLHMNGGEILSYVSKEIPIFFKELELKYKFSREEIEKFIFHQANAFILNHIENILQIPKDKSLRFLEEVGNTTSSSIPIVLEQYLKNRSENIPEKFLLCGFGVGMTTAAVTIYI